MGVVGHRGHREVHSQAHVASWGEQGKLQWLRPPASSPLS